MYFLFSIYLLLYVLFSSFLMPEVVFVMLNTKGLAYLYIHSIGIILVACIFISLWMPFSEPNVSCICLTYFRNKMIDWLIDPPLSLLYSRWRTLIVYLVSYSCTVRGQPLGFLDLSKTRFDTAFSRVVWRFIGSFVPGENGGTNP